MKKYLIIYHKEDNDGLFSMAITYNYLIHELGATNEDIELSGQDYGSLNSLNLEDIVNNYENIIMTDISINVPDKMKYLKEFTRGSFVWIDHHAPALKTSLVEKYDDIPGHRDTNRSAILNIYRYFYDPLDEAYQNKTCPEYFRILSGWDSFTFEQEGYTTDYCRNINVGTNVAYELNPTAIINIVYNMLYTTADFSEFITELHHDGELVNKAKDIEMADIIKNVGDFTWTIGENNRQVCVLFMQGATNSLMFSSVKTKVKVGAIFKRNSNGTWVISVYNTSRAYDSEFHCGDYLKKNYNGGGHAGAGGCHIGEEKFLELLKTKHI